jgi:hypothetical protein
VGGEGGFDLERGHPNTAYLEHVVGAAAVGEVAVLTLDVFVAALCPRAEEGVPAFLAVVPIKRGAGGAGDLQFADVSFGDCFAVVVYQADVIAGNRLTRSAVAHIARPVR